MSKLKDLLMMAVEKEQFKIGDKTFQIIEVVEAEQPQPDEVKKILVPSEIGIVGDKEGIGVAFGTNQCLLSRTTDELPYRVVSQIFVNPIQCELIKCERAELKKGDLAFMNWDEEVDFSRLSSYRVIISDDDYCYIENNANIRTRLGDANRWNPGTPKHLYKLQPIQ